jgi:pimeloyl-ACP methyl ester carboxylesterase
MISEITKLNGLQRDIILEHLKELDDRERYFRFGHLITDKQLSEYTMAINLNRDLVLGVFDNEKLIAFAHVALYQENGYPVAELGLSVDIRFRNQGMGFDMITYCLKFAKERLATKVYIHTMISNKPMYALMNKIESDMIVDNDELTVIFNLNEQSSNSQIKQYWLGDIEIFEKKVSQDNSHPTILFIHGAGGDGWQFRQYFMPYFAEKNINTIALSLPNHGQTKIKSHKVDAYLETIKKVHQSINGKVILVAHSMGGWLAQKYASEISEESLQFEKLILLASVPPFNYDSMNNNFTHIIEEELKCVLARENIHKLMEDVKPVNIENIHMPVVCIAGIKDTVIPIEWKKRTSFFYRAPLFEVDNGHNLMLGKNWQKTAEVIFEQI